VLILLSDDSLKLQGEGKMTTSDPIREQLAEARRNQILDGAAAVFADRGFHGATTKEIANAAGVSEGTIYNYFDTKFDLLIGLLSRLAEIEQLPAELTSALQGDVRSFFVRAFTHRLGRIEQGGEMLRAILPQVFVNPDLREQFHRKYVLRIAAMLEQYVQAQIELGRIRPVDVPLTVRILQSMFVGLLVLRILDDEAILSGWEDVPELLATMVFDGLGPKGEG
jgi:AcrR family transcriptional regulator